MFWHKKKKKNEEVARVEHIVDIYKSRGNSYVCVPIPSDEIEAVKEWCKHQGYNIEVDHITGDMFYYKINNWN